MSLVPRTSARAKRPIRTACLRMSKSGVQQTLSGLPQVGGNQAVRCSRLRSRDQDLEVERPVAGRAQSDEVLTDPSRVNGGKDRLPPRVAAGLAER